MRILKSQLEQAIATARSCPSDPTRAAMRSASVLSAHVFQAPTVSSQFMPRPHQK